MLDFISTLFSTALLVIAMIAGIGPQTMNTMSHAIRRNHAFAVTMTCFIGDAILILIGCLGMATLSPTMIKIVNIIGIVFLSYYLWLKLRGLNQPRTLSIDEKMVDRKTSIIRALALTWLNPLVFIDTIVVIGGMSAHYTGIHHVSFTLGALLGEGLWMFGLTGVSYKFSHKLNRPIIWLAIDITTIILVAYVLIRLVAFFL